jgi:hypothetical protein
MADDDPNDPKALDGWPIRRSRLATVAQLHALGQITLAYNYCEETAGLLFARCMTTDQQFSTKLFHKLNNRTRIDLLTAIISQNEKNEAVKSALFQFLVAYDICTDNRNILMHAILEDAGADLLKLSKRASNDPAREIHFSVPLTELRQLAQEISDTFVFGLKLEVWMTHRIRGDASDALPEIPPKPRKLTPSPPAEDQ